MDRHLIVTVGPARCGKTLFSARFPEARGAVQLKHWRDMRMPCRRRVRTMFINTHCVQRMHEEDVRRMLGDMECDADCMLPAIHSALDVCATQPFQFLRIAVGGVGGVQPVSVSL